MERAKGFEPSTSTLARLRSTRLSYARAPTNGSHPTCRRAECKPRVQAVRNARAQPSFVKLGTTRGSSLHFGARPHSRPIPLPRFLCPNSKSLIGQPRFPCSGPWIPSRRGADICRGRVASDRQWIVARNFLGILGKEIGAKEWAGESVWPTPRLCPCQRVRCAAETGGSPALRRTNRNRFLVAPPQRAPTTSDD